jgi:hypothetical protein
MVDPIHYCPHTLIIGCGKSLNKFSDCVLYLPFQVASELNPFCFLPKSQKALCEWLLYCSSIGAGGGDITRILCVYQFVSQSQL